MDDEANPPQAERGAPPDARPKVKPKSQPLLVALLLSIIAVAVGVAVWQLWPEPKAPPLPTRGYYSVDDGATWFVDEAERLPPFDHDGKPAVRVIMYSCDGGKTRFVGYLQKLPEEALQQAIREAKAAGRDPKKIDDDDVAMRAGWSAKRPGDKQWVNSKADPAEYREVTAHVACPGGKGGTPEMVYPPEAPDAR